MNTQPEVWQAQLSKIWSPRVLFQLVCTCGMFSLSVTHPPPAVSTSCLQRTQATFKRYQSEHKMKQDSLDRSKTDLKKLRRKSQGKSSSKYEVKENEVRLAVTKHHCTAVVWNTASFGTNLWPSKCRASITNADNLFVDNQIEHMCPDRTLSLVYTSINLIALVLIDTVIGIGIHNIQIAPPSHYCAVQTTFRGRMPFAWWLWKECNKCTIYGTG